MPTLPRTLASLVFLLGAAPAAITAITAHAAEMPPLATACQACHGTDGRSVAADIPHLAGQRAGYLAAQLKAFRAGTRKNDLMAAVAAQLKDEDITALANWWAGLPPAGAEPGTAAAAPPHPARVSQMRFPAGFPKGFREYRREEDANAKTVALSYANDAAWQAAAAGKPLPDGSVILVVNHAAQLDAAGAALKDAQGRLVPGAVRSYSGMQAEAGWGERVPALLRNGNWNYGLFTATGEPRLGELHPRCLACHQPKADSSYVFLLPQLQARARQAP